MSAMTASMDGRRGFFGTQALILGFVAASLNASVMLRALFFTVLMVAGTLEAIRFGVVERPALAATALQTSDPIMASVGDEVLRVSDALAHAAFVGEDEASDVPSLIQTGTLADAVDHLALAEAARDDGLAEALEIRAALALAERQILAEAFLAQVEAVAVTEEAILARYNAESQALARDSVMRLSQIVLPSRDEAVELRKRLPGASFSSLAKKQSTDDATASQGGALGELRARDLDPRLAEATAGLTIGGVSEPIETEAGWHLLKLEARRAVRLPPFEERRAAIVTALRQEALADALDDARARVPVAVRDPEIIMANQTSVVGSTIAMVRGQ